MWREARRVRDREAGSADRPLEGTGEVAVRGEPQRAPLRVPDPDALDDRGLAASGCGFLLIVVLLGSQNRLIMKR